MLSGLWYNLYDLTYFYIYLKANVDYLSYKTEKKNSCFVGIGTISFLGRLNGVHTVRVEF